MNKLSNLKIYGIVALFFIVASSCKQGDKTNENVKAEKSDEMISTDVVENTTEITFDKDTYNFGEVKQGDTVRYDFKFTNTGSHDLVISGARGSCGCTVPEWPKRPIPPGESDVIKVQFNSKNKKGAQNKTVTITANTRPSETKIYITGTVKAPE